MTPGEWLAIILLGSTAIGLARDTLDPDVVKLKVNSAFWVFFLVCVVIAELTLSLVILL